ncbi:oxidoreductase-like protein [Xylaria intraflava]|nr:oxidoreductase-like protein [Xylaria intraflava]
MTERTKLPTRDLPQMASGNGAPGSLTAPLAPFLPDGSMSPSRACQADLMILDLNPAEAEAKVEKLRTEFSDVPTAKILSPIVTLLNLAGTVCCNYALNSTFKDLNRVINFNTTRGFLVVRETGGRIIFCPGYMDTILETKKIWLSRTPMGRIGQLDEFSRVMVMLASKAGSCFDDSDHKFVVDGGQTLLM